MVAVLLGAPPPGDRKLGGSLRYGYGNVAVLGAAGAFSAGIELEIDVLTGRGELHQPWASFAHAVPLAGPLILIDPLIPVPFALTAVILTAMVAVLTWRSPLPEGRIAA